MAKNSEESKLITPGEVVAILGISGETLRRWRKENYGPSYVKLSSKKYLYPRDSLMKWVKKRTYDTKVKAI